MLTGRLLRDTLLLMCQRQSLIIIRKYLKIGTVREIYRNRRNYYRIMHQENAKKSAGIGC